MRALRMVVLASTATAVLAGVIAGTAAAEPPPAPTETTIVAVGSDTVQSLFDKWQTDFNGQTPPPANNMVSYDAFPGSATITPKPTCTAITRPNGSGAGLTALNNKTTTTDGLHYCVDVARDSKAAVSGAGDAYVQFAKDAITWAANSGGNAPTNITSANLKLIYAANTGSCLTWNQVGGTSTAAIKPVLPQGSSGTRSQFIADLGLTAATLGTCVINRDGSQVIEENEGVNCVFWTGTCPPNTTSDPNVLYPFSIGSYICQADLGNCTNNVGHMVLGSIDGKTATTGTGVNTVINALFPTVFIRTLYAVTLYTGVAANPIPDGTASPGGINLRPLLGNGNNTGWICSTTAQNDVKAQGFRSITSGCGNVIF